MGVADRIRYYTDSFGEDVSVELIDPTTAIYDPDRYAVVIGESEQGGDYSVAAAIATLEHLQAPADIIDWVRAAA